MGSVDGWPLIYIYAKGSPEKLAIPRLRKEQLLVPPLIANHRPWTMGYFEFLEGRPLGTEDRLRQHLFRDIRGWCVNERGERQEAPVQPVVAGIYGLSSFRTIDDDVSKAIGLPRAPD